MNVSQKTQHLSDLKTAQGDASSVAVSSGAITLNPNLNRKFVVNVNANITSITIITPKAACDFQILFQFAGSYSVNGFPSGIKWMGSNTPAFTGVSGEECLVVCSFWGSSTYRADSTGIYDAS